MEDSKIVKVGVEVIESKNAKGLIVLINPSIAEKVNDWEEFLGQIGNEINHEGY